MIFERDFYQKLIDRSEQAIKEVDYPDYRLDQHTDSPHEGGCSTCFFGGPCLTAAALARRVLELGGDDSR